MPRIEMFEQLEELEQSSSESFDRIAFAEEALGLVRPPKTTVAICIGSGRVRVEAGRQWGGEAGARWAVLSVPPNASREAIAHAVLEISGGHSKPWAFDVLFGSIGSGQAAE